MKTKPAMADTVPTRAPQASENSNQQSTASPTIDVTEAQRFLDLLAPDEDVTFQTFPEPTSQKESKSLIRVIHGRLKDCAAELTRLNESGAGIFFMVNAGDGKVHEGERSCRTKKNVIRVRANFVDLDGSPLEPVMESPAVPSIVVSTSPGRWHAYWLVEGEPLSAFTPTQEELNRKFSTDPTVKDLPRVMRLPGYLHRKATPFLTRMTYPTMKRD